jgi:hypothetical protein
LMQRWLRLRPHDRPPTTGEITLYLGVWSVLFEWIGPRIMPWTVGDPWDVAAYAVGAVLAGLWWHRPELTRSSKAHEL